jgi:hypothetical protein
MSPQTFSSVAEFARLDRAVAEFRQVRAELGMTGVSWIMADRQLEILVAQVPKRARQILDTIEHAPVAGNDPDAPQPICPTCH